MCSVLAVTLAIGTPARAADDPELAARVDAFVAAEMARQHVPGIALAILRNGKPLLVKGYGLANIEHGVPVKPETVFQSGSMGKQFTAAAVMLLVADGRLGLDDPLTRFFPDAPAAWKAITVHHLLNHTSGLGDWPRELDLRRDFSEDDLLAMVEASPLLFPPGARWSYSNLGYVTLGLVVHRVTGTLYGEVLRERVFAPLGMSTARVISEADIVPNRAAGYELVAGRLANQEWVAPSVNTTADGSLYLTVLDMAKWDAALYGDRPLSGAVKERMWAPTVLADGTSKAYGFGWHSGTLAGRRAVFHGGAWQGFQSYVIRFLDDRLTIVFFANLKQAHPYRLARGLAALFHSELRLPAVSPIADEPEVRRLVQRALNELADGNPGPETFTPAALASLASAEGTRLGDLLRTLELPVAVIAFAELVDRRDAAGSRTSHYVLTGLESTLDVTLATDLTGKIATLDVALREPVVP
jgi:CubicO group peptidase (beta-lactamase class C family)